MVGKLTLDRHSVRAETILASRRLDTPLSQRESPPEKSRLVGTASVSRKMTSSPGAGLRAFFNQSGRPACGDHQYTGKMIKAFERNREAGFFTTHHSFLSDSQPAVRNFIIATFQGTWVDQFIAQTHDLSGEDIATVKYNTIIIWTPTQRKGYARGEYLTCSFCIADWVHKWLQCHPSGRTEIRTCQGPWNRNNAISKCFQHPNMAEITPHLATLLWTTGGSCRGSPTRTNLRETKRDPKQDGCKTWEASSMMHTSNVRRASTGWDGEAPRHVVAITG